jgi:D-alanine-D-alanine ligase
MKRNIAIVAGGDQSEVVVSIKSAKGIYSFINHPDYSCYITVIEKDNWHVLLPDETTQPIDKNDFSFLLNGEKITFDCAYITIHGIPGEDGRLQGYFEMIDMPYTSCNVLTSAITYNKYVCNNYLKGFGINIAPSLRLRKNDKFTPEEVIDKVGLPCFVKPNLGGSSFGVTKVKSIDEIVPAIEKAFAEAEEVIIESFMQGTEITNGIFKTAKRQVVLPITEVVPANEFFDFAAKYKGEAQEITPARLSPELTAEVQKTTASIYNLLGCKGIVRIDYIITNGNKINLLEVNTTPGMTPTSFIPQQIPHAGLEIGEVIEEIIEDAILNKSL